MYGFVYVDNFYIHVRARTCVCVMKLDYNTTTLNIRAFDGEMNVRDIVYL